MRLIEIKEHIFSCLKKQFESFGYFEIRNACAVGEGHSNKHKYKERCRSLAEPTASSCVALWWQELFAQTSEAEQMGSQQAPCTLGCLLCWGVRERGGSQTLKSSLTLFGAIPNLVLAQLDPRL